MEVEWKRGEEVRDDDVRLIKLESTRERLVESSVTTASGVRGLKGRSSKNLFGSVGSVMKEKELGLLGTD